MEQRPPTLLRLHFGSEATGPPRRRSVPLDAFPAVGDLQREIIWQDLQDFYRENEAVIELSLQWDAKEAVKDDNSQRFYAGIEAVLDTADIILDGLVVLANVHPVFGVAIYAFRTVMKLDLARRDNNRKVLAVKIQMQNLMCTLFQLRKLKHMHVDDDESLSDKRDLERLMADIARDITKCGSDLTYYLDRRLISKLINSKQYEKKFSDHIQKFAIRRSELQNLMTVYTAAGIDVANISIGDIGHKLDTLHGAIEKMFRKLDTLREREVLSFMSENGGPEDCIKKDELLSELFLKSGESIEDSLPTTILQGRTQEEKLFTIREQLKAELAKDFVEEALAKHADRFEKIINVFNSNQERLTYNMEQHGYMLLHQNTKLDQLVSTSISLVEQGKLIKKAVVPNASVKMKDPQLEQIWNRMNLKRSVKAKHFVLTLRDHFHSDHLNSPGTPSNVTLSVPFDSTSSEPAAMLGAEPKIESDPDLWVFDYLDVAHVQPLVEAIDVDGSGFISVDEGNKFATSRPKRWSLLQWIAYWAAGWHINITHYRDRIYSIMLRLHNMSFSTLSSNQAWINYYLNSFSFRKIEGLLRSTRPLPDNARRNPKLLELSESMASLEEQRLRKNLKEMSYVLESPSDVTVVAGSMRVETWIYPLLYLVLDHHLEIFKVADKRTLGSAEMTLHVTSLLNIFSIFTDRMNKLEVIFRQMYRDCDAQFSNHAYGMFYTFFNHTASDAAKSTLLEYKELKLVAPEVSTTSGVKSAPNISVLSKELGPNLGYKPLDIHHDSFAAPPDHIQHAMEGNWHGYCALSSSPDVAYIGPLRLFVGPVIDDVLKGIGELFSGVLDIDGEITSKDSSGILNVSLQLKLSKDRSMECQGRFDPNLDTMQGEWVFVDINSATSTVEDSTEKDSETDKSEVSSDKYIDDVKEEYILNEDEKDEEDEEVLASDWPPRGNFYFSRNPPEVFSRGHLSNGVGVDFPPEGRSARQLWDYAMGAVVTQIRRAKLDIVCRLSERQKWVELSVRCVLEAFIPEKPAGSYFSSPQRAEWNRLVQSTPPENARLYEEIAMYSLSRSTYDLGGITCDACDRRIIFSRFLCVTCIEEDMSNQIDFCSSECIDARSLARERNFLHHHSHSLVWASRRIHMCELRTMISNARQRSQRIQASFKAAEVEKSGATTKGFDSVVEKYADQDYLVESKPTLTSLVCSICSTMVTLPCWACAGCALDILVCLNCERKGILKNPWSGIDILSNHSAKHPLLRINADVEIKTTSNDLQANRMDKQLKNMEERMSTSIDNGLSTLEKKIVSLEKKMYSGRLGLQTAMKLVPDNDSISLLTKSPIQIETNPKIQSSETAHPGGQGCEREHTNVTPSDTNRDSSQIQTTYSSRVEERLDALETKVDSILKILQDAFVKETDGATGSDFVPYWSRGSRR